ncbi:EamA family transporter [Nonomuraea sp. KC401]|uniref:DMT family transporter n=1 Tax=unclassified Nonomuraea TaxID=2593643 RepID=UPI0010FE7551|nr:MULTISPECIES: EamA family transporter [unclassified Nonomuraea]NBE91701.1 EamA family transporter [Nonomuraea sp. K271]TLF85841.1 EamA family transporter [Nonomuraea sp. KC401]
MRNGPLAVVGASVLWGTAGTAGLLVSADSVALAAARLVIGGTALALYAGAGLRDTIRPALLLGAAAVAAYQLCYFAAVARTGVAIGTVVAIGSGPVFTGLLSWLMHGRRPSGRWTAATTAAICGSAALIVGGGTQAGGEVVSGVLLALLGGLLYAFYAVMAAREIGRGARSDAVMGVMFGGSAVVMLPILLANGVAWLGEPRGLAAVLYLGLGTTALSYFLYGRGLRSTPVATAATLALAEPAVAALLGLVVLGERLAPVSVAGLVLLALSLVVVAVPERTRERALESQP